MCTCKPTQLLAGIREMVEGGVVFDKNTVKDLVALCTGMLDAPYM